MVSVVASSTLHRLSAETDAERHLSESCRLILIAISVAVASELLLLRLLLLLVPDTGVRDAVATSQLRSVI